VAVRPLANDAPRLKTYVAPFPNHGSKVASELVWDFMKQLASMNKAAHLSSPFQRETVTSDDRCSCYSSRRCLRTIWRSI
jgi:hypothetical protein